MSSKNLTEKEYIKMALGKTAAPIAASLKFGAIMNGANKSQVENLGRYGNNVGLAFQVHDDIIIHGEQKSDSKKFREHFKPVNRGSIDKLPLSGSVGLGRLVKTHTSRQGSFGRRVTRDLYTARRRTL